MIKMLSKNQRILTMVESLQLLIIVAILDRVCWYVRRAQQNANKLIVASVKTSQPTDMNPGANYVVDTAKGHGNGLDAYPDGTETYQNVFYRNYNTCEATYSQYTASSKERPTMDVDASLNKIIGSLKSNLLSLNRW